jgi:hypothetical protein
MKFENSLGRSVPTRPRKVDIIAGMVIVSTAAGRRDGGHYTIPAVAFDLLASVSDRLLIQFSQGQYQSGQAEDSWLKVSTT